MSQVLQPLLEETCLFRYHWRRRSIQPKSPAFLHLTSLRLLSEPKESGRPGPL